MSFESDWSTASPNPFVRDFKVIIRKSILTSRNGYAAMYILPRAYC